MTEIKPIINIDDFTKIQLKVGKILKWETIDGADKLYKFTVDVGEVEKVKTEIVNESGETVVTETENKKLRTICSGIREYFPDGNIFINKHVCVVANLAPRKMRGVESEGMLLFAGGDVGKLFFVTLEGEPEVGTTIR
jgi:methionyl-tRNA synthetase